MFVPLRGGGDTKGDVRVPPLGTEPRIERGPASQQADALPTELRHTLVIKPGGQQSETPLRIHRSE